MIFHRNCTPKTLAKQSGMLYLCNVKSDVARLSCHPEEHSDEGSREALVDAYTWMFPRSFAALWMTNTKNYQLLTINYQLTKNTK